MRPGAYGHSSCRVQNYAAGAQWLRVSDRSNEMTPAIFFSLTALTKDGRYLIVYLFDQKKSHLIFVTKLVSVRVGLQLRF